MQATYNIHPDAKARHQMLEQFLKQADQATKPDNISKSRAATSFSGDVRKTDNEK